MAGDGVTTMRDALLARIHARMREDSRVFFLSADMGAPVLDRMRAELPERCINVGIAEQNLINVASGLALEGFAVYAYAIAPFFLRAWEQIRINLSLASHLRTVDVTMMGVGAGVSYDVSGPTHHCIEDITLMRTLPNLVVCSPADWMVAAEFERFTREDARPKYIRLDGKPHTPLYSGANAIDFGRGFTELAGGEGVCLVGTGFATRKCLELARTIPGRPVGVVDVFMPATLDRGALAEVLASYPHVMTVEESIVGKGALDAVVAPLLPVGCRLHRFGFQDRYLFDFGSREYLHGLNGFSVADLTRAVAACQGAEGQG